MIVFALVVLTSVIAGTVIARFFWTRFDRDELDVTGPVERVTAGAAIATAIWLCVSWILALLHALNGPALWTLASVLALVALAFGRHVVRPSTRPSLVILPIVGWTIFALWRGAVLPPASHDALAYHLPRALLMVRAQGFGHFASPDPRLNALPANYELLLADVIAMSGTDRLTEWIGTATFLLFLLAAAALVERWWRNSRSLGEAILVTAMTPLLLLHSSAHKNDLMAMSFAVTALLWGSRWCVRGGVTPMVLLVTSLVIAGGTKPQVVAILIALSPFLIARCARTGVRLRSIAITGALSIALFVICGGAAYYAILHPGTGPAPAAPDVTTAADTFRWGDLDNLWQLPYLLITAPFSPNPLGVWVPWRDEYWFWPRYELYFSHWGKWFSILVLGLPLCAYAFRRHGEASARAERRIASWTTLLAVALILPIQIRPVGFFGALARYLLFVVPVVIAWIVPPLVDWLRGSGSSRWRSAAPATVLSALFLLDASEYALDDRFTPLQYVLMATHQPGIRAIWFENNRAASVVDRLAGPDDTIAADGGFDTWIYPAYGAQLSRRVIVLTPSAPVPPTAQWIIIDRAWNTLWGNPNLTDMGRFWEYIGRGQPTSADLHRYVQILHDPRFLLVYRSPSRHQAVFWRIDPSAPRPPIPWRGAR